MKLLIKLTIMSLLIMASSYGQTTECLPTWDSYDSLQQRVYYLESNPLIDTIYVADTTALDSLQYRCSVLDSIYSNQGGIIYIKIEDKPFIIEYADDSTYASYTKDYDSFGYSVFVNDSLVFYLKEQKWK